MSILSGEGFHAQSELSKQSAELILLATQPFQLFMATVLNLNFCLKFGYYIHGKSRELQTYFLKLIEGPINRAHLKG